MTTNTEGAPDPQTGRFAVWIAGGLGIAAIVAYGSYQAQQRLAERERVPVAAEGRTNAPAAPEQLVAQAGAATHALDVAKLASLDRELETAAAQTTKADLANDLRMTRASALSVRALEASIRAYRSREPAAARAELATTLIGGRTLTDALASEGVSPASVARIEARLDLAEGRDITLIHPVVLMPDYPDPELRLAALSRPLFSDVELAEGELTSLIDALQAAAPPTGLSRLLLAMALEHSGDVSGAESQSQAVLSRTPGQPLALAMQSAPPSKRGVAVGELEPTPPSVPAPLPPIAEPKEDVADPFVAPGTDPKSVPTPKSAPAATPKPKKPATGPKPTPKKPATAPKSAPTNPAVKPKPRSSGGNGKPKPKSKPTFDTLLDEGCKLVRSGDPSAGFNVLKKAHDIKPGGARVTLCMAQAQDKLGRAASALALVDRVLRKSPNNKTALLLAARLESAQGNKTTAEAYYRKILTLDPDNARAKKSLGED
ncbi:MAG: tetratricopeptide repeat protein [Nannocystaceae bacterium]|nr:tetratricopeptide repeat protein [Nannocystaceae bacterium]